MPSRLYTTRDDIEAAVSKATEGMMREAAEATVRAADEIADQIESGFLDMDAARAMRVIAQASQAAAIHDVPTEGWDEFSKIVARNGQAAVRKLVEMFAEKACGVAAKIESGEVEADAPEALRYFANWVRSIASDIPH